MHFRKQDFLLGQNQEKIVWAVKLFLILFLAAGFWLRYCNVEWLELFQQGSTDLYVHIFDFGFGIVLMSLLIYGLSNIHYGDLTRGTPPSVNSWIYAFVLCAQPLFGINFLAYNYTNIDEFDRIIGTATLSDYDVAKVIRNFGLWLIYFGLTLVLFAVAIEILKKKYHETEHLKAWHFLDNFVVIAGTFVFLCGIAYFTKMSSSQPFYEYSSWLIEIVFLVSFAYFLLHLNKIIFWNTYSRIVMIVALFAVPMLVLTRTSLNFALSLSLLQILFIAVLLAVFVIRKKPLKMSRHRQLVLDSAFLQPVYSRWVYPRILNWSTFSRQEVISLMFPNNTIFFRSPVL